MIRSAAAVLAILALAACSNPAASPETSGPTTDGPAASAPSGPTTGERPEEIIIGMPNPASVHCIDQGGDLQIRDTPEGQIGVCVFDDGRECEEWALFRDHQCVAPTTQPTTPQAPTEG